MVVGHYGGVGLRSRVEEFVKLSRVSSKVFLAQRCSSCQSLDSLQLNG